MDGINETSLFCSVIAGGSVLIRIVLIVVSPQNLPSYPVPPISFNTIIKHYLDSTLLSLNQWRTRLTHLHMWRPNIYLCIKKRNTSTCTRISIAGQWRDRRKKRFALERLCNPKIKYETSSSRVYGVLYS